MTINRKRKVIPPALVSAPPTPAGHIPVRLVQALGGLIRALGGNADAVFRAANVDEALLAQPDRFIPIAIRGELLERATQETGCEHLGLLLGDCSEIRALGPPGEMIPRHSTVGSALEAFAANWLLHNPATLVFVRRIEDQATFGYAVTDGSIPGMPQIQDAALAFARNIMRVMLGADWCPAAVNLMHHEPRDPSLYAHFFGAICHFNATHSELIFPATTLDFRLKNSDGKGVDLAHHALDGRDWSAYVQRLTYRLLLQGECSQKRVAAALGISDRTLVRKLANCGVNYQQFLEGARFSASRSLIRETNLTYAEIASALGYKEASSFTRAFERWSGMPPSQWRKLKTRPMSQASRKK